MIITLLLRNVSVCNTSFFLHKVLIFQRVKVKLVPERLVLLTKKTRFAVSNFEYLVKELEENEKDLCLKCRKRANLLTLPCEHNVLCEICCELNKIDVCPKCEKLINETLIIDKIKYFK